MKGDKAIGYTSLLSFDDKAFVQGVSAREFQLAKDAGKVWTRGDPTENLSPSLREFVESQNGSPSMAQITPSNAQNEHY